ncbi:MAG: hypothetical protein A2W03_11555 [Candidatus Aminicenantes bacterium RBG_16_63_16]|nr:MAG: hypothetical protein A2W03_11555 [Candidatus Aminicenantes bacterium RBG_16_63_16]
MFKRTTTAFLLAILAVGGLASCRKKAQVKGIDLTVGFSDKTLTDNLITEMKYYWKTTGELVRLPKDYTIYVHFWHGSNLLFQDDHAPQPPTSKWEPGQEYTYQRRIYIPSFIDEFDPSFKGEEELKLVVGFYNPYDRTGETKREILVRKLRVLPPPPDVPEIVYEKGWYDLEVDPQSPLKQWRWLGREARCLIDNPGRDALLVIRGGVNKDALANQKVIFKINDLVLDEFVSAEAVFEKSYNIKKEMLGDKDEFSLTITTDQVFVPAKINPQSKDERELGFQISFIYFR